jgi:hypothetical protein
MMREPIANLIQQPSRITCYLYVLYMYQRDRREYNFSSRLRTVRNCTKAVVRHEICRN